MARKIVDSDFPIGSLVPKAETGILSFLQKYPEYNGRNVTIAIMDSGTDPRAAGLQTTTDGDIKVIERFDCSGCGDTNTSKKVIANADGMITGLSGRTLKLTDEMKETNKNGNEYRIGLRSFHDLYPSKIHEKITGDIKNKKWDESYKKVVADLARDLYAFETRQSDPTNLSFKDKLLKEDMESSIEFLNGYDKKFNDIRTTYDIVVYQTEKCWYTVIDTSENGDLEKGVVIGEYSKTHEVKRIDECLYVSMNIQDNGDVVEFVGMCSSHGTHVASIASGNHFDKDLDGVAPNAKIVALSIGDGRLGSMETGTALVRAIIKVMELCNSGTKIDVINMSYGEHAHWSNSGRIGDLMNEVVNKYGVVWVCSAGNHGPALCTVGTPPDISQSCLIGVGAYVSPQMMEAEYAIREKLPANVYTWTSRDPCVDGGRGVTICAPGAAITSVPEFTMSRAQLMNGTSMASPHAAGAIALIISGLKEKGIKYSPYSIKRAISNTATLLNYVDKFAQGNGLLNVDKSFEYLLQYADQAENLIRFSIKVGNQNAKGIHLRRNQSLTKPVEVSVVIEPIFFNEKEVDTEEKCNFNVRLCLISSEPWVQCGSYLDLCYSSRTINVKVDPTSLRKGVHTASIKAYDTSCIDKGFLFEIPITVVQPYILEAKSSLLSRTFTPSSYVEFKPNTIQRDFILVPNNATWAVLRMIAIGEEEKEKQIGKFFVHVMQILSMKSCKSFETMKILPVNTENETVLPFQVEQNNVLELCIAKYWSNVGDAVLRYSLEFHGILSRNSNMMHSGNGIYRIDLSSLGNEELLPVCQLKTSTAVFKPTESKISPLSSRDVIPFGRQIYQNVLTYVLHISKAQEVAFYVPILCSLLYESEYESQFWMLFDSNKMMIACGDAYSNSTFIKIEKGDYTIKLQVRHEKKDVLEKISETNMLAKIKLQNPINVDIYDHYNQSITAGKKLSATNLIDGIPKTIFIPPLTNEKLTKASIPQPCSWLSGTISYAKDELGRKSDVNEFNYVLYDGLLSNKKNNNDNSPKKNNKNKLEEYKECLRDFQCSFIPKLDFICAEQIYSKLIGSYQRQAPLHLAFIQNMESIDNKGKFPFMFLSNYSKLNEDDLNKITTNIRRIIELATSIINEIDKDALLAYYGLKNDNRPDAIKIKTNMEKEKNMLIEAFVKKGINISKLLLIETIENTKAGVQSRSVSDHMNEIDEIYIEIGKFIDFMDLKVLHFSVWHAYVHNHNGRMAKYLSKLYEEKLNKDILEEMRCSAAREEWTFVENLIKKQILSANPVKYRPF